MNTKKDMQDTINLIEDRLNEGSEWSANNDDFLGGELAIIQEALIIMRDKLKDSKIK